MRAVLLRSLLVLAAGGLVLAGVLYVASTVDARPPEVVEVRLTQAVGDDEELALITSSLEVAFSEPVETTSAEAAVRFDPEVPHAVTWSGSTMILTPDDPLQLESEYQLLVGEGIRDAAGNLMSQSPDPFEFTTVGRPTLAASLPQNGADDVALDATVALTFSSLMDTASVEEHLRLRPAFAHELRWSGEVLEILPTEPLRTGETYEIAVGEGAVDVTGVALDEPIRVVFDTVASGLTASGLVPADGLDGVATISPIAVLFDVPIDPDSVSGDDLAITPDVAGTLEVVTQPGDPIRDDGSGRMLRFTPAAPLPPNTTFEVELLATPQSLGGSRLAAPVTWTFTTGSPPSAISNGIVFLSDRAGVANVWFMNPDGTGERQVTAELSPVTDYAVAPDGSSLVVGDGRVLVYQRANGSDRRMLTEEGRLEFDPAYAPDGDRVAFGRADVETGEGLGIWEWEVGGGEAEELAIPRELEQGPALSGDLDDAPRPYRYPRYAPDGQALAFVDLVGWVGIVELPGQRLTRAPFDAAGPPFWLRDASGVLVTGARSDGEVVETFEAPVTGLAAGDGDRVHRIGRSGGTASDLGFGAASRVLATSADGRIAYALEGRLHLAEGPDDAGPVEPLVDAVPGDAAFAPGEDLLVVGFATDAGPGTVELVDLATGERTELTEGGDRPRWLP